ncbi:MAG TPA: alpha/beta hydrolase [Candidatus Limnocylindrales bacterium]|nr:alpha/beta hydrolase [Candidatus Limnocylindrales bacterium]
MTQPAPIILVPGWWLGAWAWDEVIVNLASEGVVATALTLPGLESTDADRSSVTFEDHIAAISQAVEASERPVVLAVHSGAGFPGYATSDRVPERIAAMVYVDTGAGVGAMDAEFADVEKPLASPEDLAANENLDGLSEQQLATFRERAVPQPGGVLRGSTELANDARKAIPTVVICTAYTAEEYRDAVEKGYDFVAGLADQTDVTYVDLPTSHWPMWSRPHDLAQILADVAREHAS